jgi:hypothetical protein
VKHPVREVRRSEANAVTQIHAEKSSLFKFSLTRNLELTSSLEMQDDASTIDPQQLGAALQAMQQQLDVLQRQNVELKREQERRTGALELHEEILALFPAHIQVDPMDATDRKRLLSKYAKCDQLPGHLKDDNGLAGKAMGDGAHRKWALTHMQTIQKDALDLLRVSAVGLQGALELPDSNARSAHLMGALRDVCALSCDNAQRMARTQLDHVFETANAKGARSLLDFTANGDDLDTRDTNIIQQAHIDAMQDIRKFHTSVTANRKQQGNGKGRQLRARGGRGGYQGGYGNRGFGGRGRGGKGYRGNGWRTGGAPNGTGSGGSGGFSSGNPQS